MPNRCTFLQSAHYCVPYSHHILSYHSIADCSIVAHLFYIVSYSTWPLLLPAILWTVSQRLNEPKTTVQLLSGIEQLGPCDTICSHETMTNSMKIVELESDLDETFLMPRTESVPLQGQMQRTKYFPHTVKDDSATGQQRSHFRYSHWAIEWLNSKYRWTTTAAPFCLPLIQV